MLSVEEAKDTRDSASPKPRYAIAYRIGQRVSQAVLEPEPLCVLAPQNQLPWELAKDQVGLQGPDLIRVMKALPLRSADGQFRAMVHSATSSTLRASILKIKLGDIEPETITGNICESTMRCSNDSCCAARCSPELWSPCQKKWPLPGDRRPQNASRLCGNSGGTCPGDSETFSTASACQEIVGTNFLCIADKGIRRVPKGLKIPGQAVRA